MKILKTFITGAAVAMMFTASVSAQETPAAGSAGGQSAIWGSMASGSYVMIGGAVFLVTAAGLVLVDNDGDKPRAQPDPGIPPAATTTPASTTT